MNITQEQLLRFLDGELSADEERGLREELGRDATLRASLEEARGLRAAMRNARAESFALGFTDRVMRRVTAAESGDDALYRALGWLFRRAAIASAIAVIVFGALNAVEYRDVDVSATVLESIFGLPTVTLDDALAASPYSPQ